MPQFVYILFLVLTFSSAAVAQDWRSSYATAVKSYEAGDLPQARQLGNEALQGYLKESGALSESYAAILRLLENVCYASADYATGLEFATKELAVRESFRDKSYATALSQQGMFFQALAQYDKADGAFRAAYDLLLQYLPAGDFEVREALTTVGVNAYLRGDYTEASRIFNSVLTDDLTEVTAVFIQAFYFQGLLYHESREFSRALENFLTVHDYYDQAGLSESIENATLLVNIGNSQHSLHQFEKAEESYGKAAVIYEKAAVKDAAFARLINARAVNYQAMGQTERAQQILSQSAASDDPAVAAVLISNNAALQLSGGNYNEAVRLYRQAVERLNKADDSHKAIYAEVMHNLGVVYDEMGLYPEAEKALTESESMLAGNADNTAAVWSVKVSHGNLFLRTGRLNEAAKLFDEVYTAAAVAPSSRNIAVKALSGTALVHFKRGDLRAADSIFNRIYQRFAASEIPQDREYATVLNNYAAVKQMNGDFLAARKYLKEAVGFTRRMSGSNNIAYARALENLGFIDLDLGSLTTARTEIDSSLNLYKQILGEKSIPYALALINKGKYHQHAGEYSQAEPAFRTAFDVISSAPGSGLDEWIKGANSLAVYYQTMGNYEQAEPLFRQIRERLLKEGAGNTAEYSTMLQNLATLYQLQDNLKEAGQLLEEALAIDKKVFGEQHPQYIIALRNLAAVYQKTGRTENAQKLLEIALAATRNSYGEDHPSYASALSNLASLYQDQGKMTEAENAWSRSVALRKQIFGEQHPDYARSLYGLATVYFGQGKFTEAKEHYRQVVSQYLRQINEYFPALSEKEKGAFYQKIKPVFDAYQDFCIQYHKKNPGDTEILKELYQTQLVTKAILLNSSNKVRQTILSSGDTALVSLFRKWLGVKEQIVHHFSLSAEEQKQVTDISALRTQANDLEKRLSQASADFKTEFGEKIHTTESISSMLQPGEAAVEILRIQRKFVKDSVYYVALVLKNGSAVPEVITWPHGQKLENRFYRFHRNAIKYHVRDTISYDYYWKPLATGLGNYRKVYLSPDGIFNKINFNIIQNNEDHHWVLEDFTIHLVSNTREIVEHASRKPSPANLINLYGYADFQLALAQGNHPPLHTSSLNRNFGFNGEIPVLPGTKVEVEHIHRLFEERQFVVNTYKADAASEFNIKKTPNVKVLHIATHGFFMNDVTISDAEGDDRQDFFNNPLLRSGILLAGAGVNKSEADLSGEDGILTAYEAMNIDLSETDLVVLSACETALGELKNGEGVYGLQRAFIVAGASAVMMSLWQVDDVATQELMVNFYERWLGGQPKHEAFRQAQLAIKEKYPSPYYWGAFILIGQ